MARNVLKYLGIGILLLFAVLIAVANIGRIFWEKNQKEYDQTLEGMVAEINQHLPMKDPNGFDFYTLSHVALDSEKVVFDATLDTTFFYPIRESLLPESMNGGILPSGSRNDVLDLDTVLSEKLLKDSHRLSLLYQQLFTNKNGTNKFYEELKKRGYSLTWRTHSPFSDRQLEFSFTSKELDDLEIYCKNHPDSALKEFLNEYLKRQNRVLSLASRNADARMSMIDNGEDIVFIYVFDKTYSAGGNQPISNLRNFENEIYEALKDDSEHLPFFYSAKEICNKTNRSYVFRFFDFFKTDSLDIIIYNSIQKNEK